MATGDSACGIAIRTRRKVALRLLPFVFLLYVVAYIDRVNVSFASLRMNTELGFSDQVYGLGVGFFYVSYVLLEIPGAIIAERWSPRKWLGRIMISWGVVTVLTALIQNSAQFYLARFLLGAAEASFLPAMMVYLTRWFTVQDRSRAIACLFAAIPAASLIGAPLAGALIGVDWWGWAGWRWLFVIEGIPAVALGVIALTYLADRPAAARWLDQGERQWIGQQIAAELEAKRRLGQHTILGAFRDRRVLLLAATYFMVISGALANIYWLPTFVRRISGLTPTSVGWLIMIPGVIGLVGTLLNGWHSDKSGERRWHAAAPLLVSGVLYGCVVLFSQHSALSIAALFLAAGTLYSFYPPFWALPTLILSDTAAAASFGLIVSISQIGGIAGPYLVGFLNDRTHSLAAGLGCIAVTYLVGAGMVLTLAGSGMSRGGAIATEADRLLPRRLYRSREPNSSNERLTAR
jgi:MFS transporter, ACS family, tartrate transporter